MAESIFKIPENRIRVVTPDVGGGFGMKFFLYPEHILVLWAAKKLGRPVKWTPERSDAFMTDTQGRDNLTRLELALDDELRFLGLKVATIANMGAYLSNFAPEIPTGSGGVMYSGVYAIPAIHVAVKGVFTHTVPVDAYRGAGRPEAAYAIERLIDFAARRLGVAPQELRRRNFIKPEAMPYATPLGLVYDSGDFARNMEDALAAADAPGFPARRAASRARGRYRGLRPRRLYRAVGDAPRRICRIALRPERRPDDPDGHAILGPRTSDRLCPARRRTARAAARKNPGAAGRHRRDRLWPRHRRFALAAGRRRRARQRRGQADRQGPPHRRASVGSGRGRSRLCRRRLPHIGHRPRNRHRGGGAGRFQPRALPADVEPGFAESGHFTPPAATFPNGCHVCEVEIEPETGQVDIVRYLVVDDFGTVVNPLLLEGQVQGGIAQGVGQAMLEHCVFDPQTGQLVTGSLTDYCLPRADDLPAIEFAYNVVPCRTNPLGLKGAGEAGAIGAPPALVNAIVDALAPLGIEHIDMPVTPERLWRAIRTADRRAAA